MAGKHATITQIKQALVLRAIGLSRTAIAEETGLSESTVARIMRRHHAKKGSAVDKLAEETQRQLVETVAHDDRLRLEAAKLMLDDLALSRLLRDKLAATLHHLNTDDPDSAPVNARALSSAASALITSQKAARIAIGADQERLREPEMPVLRIEMLSVDQIEEMRAAQRAELESEEDETAVAG